MTTSFAHNDRNLLLLSWFEGEPEYELEEISDSRLHDNKLQYRAKWTGYSPAHEKTWYPADNFENADLVKRNFDSRNQNKRHLDQT